MKWIYHRPRLLVFFLGAMSTLALAPFYLWWVLLITLPLFFLLLENAQDVRRGFILGWLFGFGHHLTGLYWISHALLIEPREFIWLVPFAASGLPALFAIYLGVLGAIMKLFPAGHYPLRALFFACLWVLLEWLRGVLLTGFPWNYVGYAFADSLTMMQFASVAGVYGLSFIIVLAAVCMVPVFKRQKYVKIRREFPALGLLLLVSNFAFGYWQISQAKEADNHLTVTLVQGNIAQQHRWQDEERVSIIERHMKLSRNLPGRLIIWPESAIPYFSNEDPGLRKAVASVLKDDQYLLSGSLGIERALDNVNVWNGMVAIDTAGQMVDFYQKYKLVPFGEYVPLHDFFPFIDKITHGSQDFMPGATPRTLIIGDIPPFAPLMCYEVIFPELVRDAANRGAQWILNLTNDAWFGRSTGPYQHEAMARMRAVELRLPLVRVANTGVSVVFDPYGRELYGSDIFTPDVRTVELPLYQQPVASMYKMAGNLALLPYLILAVIVGCFTSYTIRVKNKNAH